jgi:bromodomain-containing factor 1
MRDSFGGLERPKREVHAPSRELNLAPTKKKLPRKITPELKFCSYVHKELTKKHHSPYNIPFLLPVDPDALGIPQYRTIVKNPMDLSTIRKRLDAGDYENATEFESDVRLMLGNCFLFNAPGSEVYNMGKQLEAVFNVKWAEKYSFIQQHSDPFNAKGLKPTPKSLSSLPAMALGGDSSDDDEDGKPV